MGQGASAPPPPPQPPQPADRPSASQRLQHNATQAAHTVKVYAVSARALWDDDATFNIGARVRRRLTDHVGVIRRYPEQSAAAIAVGTACGAAVFALGRVGTCLALQSLRISSHNRAAATAVGAVGLVCSSSLAAHSFLLSSTLVAERKGVRNWPLLPVPPTSHAFGMATLGWAALSLAQFRLLGGRLRYWAPSDVIRPGSFAHKALPAPGNDYADLRIKRLLAVQGGKHGCHHCGRSRSWLGMGPRLRFIGDHIPPNKYAKLADQASGAFDPPGRGARPWWVRLLPFLRPTRTPQVFLPQCERCSLIQSNAVRMDRRTLIFPRSWRWYDVWLPLPVLLVLLLLPAWTELDERFQREKKRAQRVLPAPSQTSNSSGWW